MNIQPTVSVIVPAYNAARWITEALDSALAQSYPVLEVLVVDDGSTDDTPRIVESLGERVHLLRERHRGLPQRNRGISAARGELIAFLDADDRWEPAKLEKQVRALLRQGTDWAICDSLWLDASTGAISAPGGARIRGGDILESLLLRNFIVTSTVVVSRAALDAVGPFDESLELITGEDWDLWLRLAAKHRLACVQEPLATLRLHSASWMRSLGIDRGVHTQENVIRRAVHLEPGRLAKLRDRALTNVYHSAAIRLVRANRLAQARVYFWRAWIHSPSRLESAGYIAATMLGTRGARTAARLKRRFLGQGRIP